MSWVLNVCNSLIACSLAHPRPGPSWKKRCWEARSCREWPPAMRFKRCVNVGKTLLCCLNLTNSTSQEYTTTAEPHTSNLCPSTHFLLHNNAQNRCSALETGRRTTHSSPWSTTSSTAGRSRRRSCTTARCVCVRESVRVYACA